MTPKGAPLAVDAQERLLRRVELMQHAASTRPPERELVLAWTRRTDFSTLPGYEELRLYHSIGRKFGIDNPYFRMHDGRAGSHTQIAGRSLLNFSSYDYLGLNGHPEITAAAKAAIDRYGVSASASRHVAGERSVHRALERGLASHYGVEDSLVFVSGYATNLGVVGHLVGSRDIVIYDALAHNSIVMGGVLSGAARRCFAHNDLDNLEQILLSTLREVRTGVDRCRRALQHGWRLPEFAAPH